MALECGESWGSIHLLNRGDSEALSILEVYSNMSLGVRSQIEFVGEQNCTRISRMFLKFSNECNLAPISTLFLNKVILILYGQSIESSKAILSNT